MAHCRSCVNDKFFFFSEVTDCHTRCDSIVNDMGLTPSLPDAVTGRSYRTQLPDAVTGRSYRTQLPDAVTGLKSASHRHPKSRT